MSLFDEQILEYDGEYVETDDECGVTEVEATNSVADVQYTPTKTNRQIICASIKPMPVPRHDSDKADIRERVQHQLDSKAEFSLPEVQRILVQASFAAYVGSLNSQEAARIESEISDLCRVKYAMLKDGANLRTLVWSLFRQSKL